MREADLPARANPDAAAIRTAMSDQVIHRSESGIDPRQGRATQRKHTCNAAHGRIADPPLSKAPLEAGHGVIEVAQPCAQGHRDRLWHIDEAGVKRLYAVGD